MTIYKHDVSEQWHFGSEWFLSLENAACSNAFIHYGCSEMISMFLANLEDPEEQLSIFIINAWYYAPNFFEFLHRATCPLRGSFIKPSRP